MQQGIHLILALYLAINAKSEIAIQQILQRMYYHLDFDPSKKLIIRLLPLLTPRQRDYLKSLS